MSFYSLHKHIFQHAYIRFRRRIVSWLNQNIFFLGNIPYNHCVGSGGIDQNQGFPQLFFLVYAQVENKIMATPTSSPIDIKYHLKIYYLLMELGEKRAKSIITQVR